MGSSVRPFALRLDDEIVGGFDRSAAEISDRSKRGADRRGAKGILFDTGRRLVGLLETIDPHTAERRYDLAGGGLAAIKSKKRESKKREIIAMETPLATLLREIPEETGYSASQIADTTFLGTCEERRGALGSTVTTYFYLVLVSGAPQGTPKLTERERSRRPRLVWLTPEMAVERLSVWPRSYAGRFDHLRALLALPLPYLESPPS